MELGFVAVPSASHDSVFDTVAHGDKVYAVGARGLILTFDGTRWVREPSPVTDDVIAVASLRNDKLLAVTRDRNILVRGNEGWEKLRQLPPVAMPNGEAKALPHTGIWIGGEHDIWVRLHLAHPSRRTTLEEMRSDSYDYPGKTILRYWNGRQWRDPELPEIFRITTWVVPRADDVFVGGIRPLRRSGLYRRSRSGSTADAGWELTGGWRQESALKSGVRHMWEAPSGDLYVACLGELYRLRGDEWTTLVDSGPAFMWVMGNEKSVYAVGNYHRGPVYVYSSKGGRWERGARLHAGWINERVSIALPDRVLIVGDTHWGDQAWSALYANGRLSRIPGLRDLWGRADDDIYAVGSNGRILHFDGERWRSEESGTSKNLHSISGTPDGEHVYAVGDGTIVLREKGRWSEVPMEYRATAWSIWAGGENEVYAGHWYRYPNPSPRRGRVMRFNGLSWEYIEGCEDVRSREIWGIDGQHVYALDKRTLWNVATCESREIPEKVLSGDSVMRISGPSANDLWLAVSGMRVIRFDGESFTLFQLVDRPHYSSMKSLTAISSSEREVIVGTSDGETFHRVEGSWCRAETGIGGHIRDIWIAPSGEAWAVGDQGALLRRRPTAPPSP